MAVLPTMKRLLSNFKEGLLFSCYEKLDELRDLYELLEKSIIEEPPLSIRDGGIIKEGYQKEIDMLRNAKRDGKDWLAELEARERERSGIKSLRMDKKTNINKCRTIYNTRIKRIGTKNSWCRGTIIFFGI